MKGLLTHVCALVLLAFATSLASAQSSEDPAQEAFALGMEHAQREQWEQAAEAFRSSNALAPRAGALQNLIFALLQLGRKPAALSAVEEYLAAYDHRAAQGLRTQLRELRRELSREVAVVKVVSSPEQAELSVLRDDQTYIATTTRQGSARVLWLAAGSYTLRLTEPGFAPVEREVQATPGQTQELSLSLPRLASPPAVTVLPKSALKAVDQASFERPLVAKPAKVERPLVRKWWVWAGVAALVGGVSGLAVALASPGSRVQAPLGPAGEIERL